MNKHGDRDNKVSDFFRRLTEHVQGDQNSQGFGLGFHRAARISVTLRPRDGYPARRSVRMDALEWPRGYPAHDDL